MLPVLLAFASMVCAAANDVVFKVYANKRSPVGPYILVIGLLWAAIFGVLMYLYESGLNYNTVLWGAISGTFGVTANLLLVQTMKQMEMGICATVYRMNLIPAAIVAVLFLNEDLSLWKLAGLVAAVLAVLLFFKRTDKAGASAGVLPWCMLILACFLRAGMGLTYKWGMIEGASLYGLLCINGLAWILGGLIYWFGLESRMDARNHMILNHGALSGVLTAGIVLFLGKALRDGDASLVLPLAQLSFLPTCIVGIILLKEGASPRKLAGMFMAVGCIACMAMST
ncbi:MAG: EamA family transporter [Planctomycetes bacterium]|nr:EamA family transporter [Planctomycetota bacterium]